MTDMGFLDKLADWLAPSKPSVPSLASTPDLAAAQPPAPQFAPVPPELPRISERSAAELCKECKPDPAALQLLNPQQTPAQFLAVLQERNLGADMVKVLAQGLPDREGVAWAVKCALKVADKLPAADALAMRAAEAWVKDPTAERQAAAAAAAQRTDFQGPGAWAAQAAASARGGATAFPEGMEAPRLTPHSVGGAVLLSSSILAAPEYAARILSAAQAAISAAAGIAAGGASAHLRAPTLSIPGSPSVPNVSVPQLPGTAGKIQAGLGALPSAGGLAASGASLPGVAGALSSPLGTIAQGAASGGAAGAAAAALGSVPVLRGAAATAAGMAVSVPGAAALAGVALPNPQMPSLAHGSIPSFSQPNIPHMQMPNVPPPDPVAIFRGQQPFIEIGIGIASGKVPVA